MAFKSNEIKIGVLLVATLVVLGIFFTAIFGVSVGKETHEFRVNLDYVGGITKGSLVKYRGLNVGQIREILLPGQGQTRLGLLLDVTADTPVREDSRAFVTSIGLMAEQHVEISAGSPDVALLPPGSTLESKEVLGFSQMSETMGDLSDQMQTLVTSLNDMMNPENRQHLASILENVDLVIRDGRTPMLSSLEGLNAMSGEMKSISNNIAAMTDTSQGNMNRILANLERTTASTRTLITDMNETLRHLQSTLTVNHQNVADMMENFQRVSHNFEEFSRMISEQPWLLVRKAAPPERKN